VSEPDPTSETLPPDAAPPAAAAANAPAPPILEPAAGASPPGRMSKFEAVAEMAICSSIPTQLAIGWALRLAGWSPVNDEGQLQLGFVAALSLLDTAVLVALMAALLRSHGERPAALWLGGRSIAREAMAGVTHVPIVFLIGSVLLLSMRALTPQLHNVDVNPFETLAGNSITDAVLLTLVAILAGGVREELQRAFLLDRFVRHLGPPWAAVLLLSVAFGLGHLLQGRDAAVATGAMGAFWAVVYLRRGSSVAPVMSHALFNTIEVLQIAVLTS
jgi:membrane protease YdiL (CAAX protease family)